MVNITILEGLKRALIKGDSLKQAMISFYNASYNKEEIEQAARGLQMQQRDQPLPVQPKQIQPKKNIQKQVVKKAQPIQRISNYGKVTGNQQKESIQKIKQGITNAIDELEKIEFPKGHPTNGVPLAQNISSYKQKPKLRTKMIATILIIVLILLLGIVISLFLFKDNIIKIVNSLGFFK